MLPKTKRLTKTRDFMKLAVQGRPVFGPFATLRVRKLTKGETRIAFITSTKVFKRSVDRNRAKRRMRAVLRSLLSEIPESLHLLFILKPETRDVKYELLVKEIRRLLSKIPEALTRPAKPSTRGSKFLKKYPTPKSI